MVYDFAEENDACSNYSPFL